MTVRKYIKNYSTSWILENIIKNPFLLNLSVKIRFWMCTSTSYQSFPKKGQICEIQSFSGCQAESLYNNQNI